MSVTRANIDEHLAALDTSIVMMRAQGRERAQLLEVFELVAKRILAEAGPHAEYVTARLMTILVSNGLGREQRT
jgi:hypothetical protein